MLGKRIVGDAMASFVSPWFVMTLKHADIGYRIARSKRRSLDRRSLFSVRVADGSGQERRVRTPTGPGGSHRGSPSGSKDSILTFKSRPTTIERRAVERGRKRTTEACKGSPPPEDVRE
jgi:hypothetical protein